MVQVGELADLALKTLAPDDERRPLMLQIIAQAVHAALAAKQIYPSLRAPEVSAGGIVVRISDYEEVRIALDLGYQTIKPRIAVSSGRGNYGLISEVQRVIGETLTTLGQQVLAAQMAGTLEADGYETEMEVDENGDYVVAYRKEVFA